MANTFYQAGDLQNAEAHYRNGLRDISSYAHYEARWDWETSLPCGDSAIRRRTFMNALSFAIHIGLSPSTISSLFLGSDADKLGALLSEI